MSQPKPNHKQIHDELAKITQRALSTRYPQHLIKMQGISFNAVMVHAILSGKKTETRRLATTPQCSLGQPGDMLYVREPFLQTKTGYDYAADDPKTLQRYRPAMYMPREAARIFLKIASIDQQHLQDVSPTDAIAEGCPAVTDDPVLWFKNLWNSIYPDPGKCWEDNPLIWRICFHLAEPVKS